MWSALGPASPGLRASGQQLGHRRCPPSPVLLPGLKETEIKSHTSCRWRCGLNGHSSRTKAQTLLMEQTLSIREGTADPAFALRDRDLPARMRQQVHRDLQSQCRRLTAVPNQSRSS